MPSLLDLPPEMLWHIVSFFDLAELAVARLACSTLRRFCDHPSHWRVLSLRPPQSCGSDSALDLWHLHDLERLIAPHVAHVRTIEIWGVRDPIVRYLLTHCSQLLDLTVCGWTTLSNHAFAHTDKPMRLRRLELIGDVRQPNYAGIDARVLSQLLRQCPDLQSLVLGCQVHIHARTLLRELKKASSASSCPAQKLTSLTLATRRTWSRRHVAELMDRCPALERVCLLPAAARGFDLEKSHDAAQWPMAADKVAVQPSSDSDDGDDMDHLASDTIVLRSSLLE